jgi:predicted dehydrogenase
VNQVRVGLVGCGGFARGMHIPNLRANDKFEIVAVCDTDPDAVRAAQALAGAGYATADIERLLADPTVDAVFVTTRHDSHADLSIRAARAGKHVLCEKPMGLNLAQCHAVAQAVRAAGVVYTVGYNRGMAPLVQQARAHLQAHPARKLIYHRIQAPFPPAHWIHDPDIGGGRLVGEGCHIFDLLCELVGAPPVQVYAAGGTFLDPALVPTLDSAVVTLTFADGSVGVTLIASDGCAAFPKEATEIYWGGRAIYLDNYQRMAIYGVSPSERQEVDLGEVDKGHRVEIDQFADAILHGVSPPNGLVTACRAALISYLAVESLQSGRPLGIDPNDYTV